MTEHASRRVLLLGGAGFVGAHMADNCRMRGWSVVALDNLSARGAAARLARLRESPDFHLVETDWLAGDAPPELTKEKFDFVVHAATASDAVEDLRLHAEGVERALRLAARDRAVFLYLSCASVYGDVSAAAMHEDAVVFKGDWTRPEHTFAQARRHAETLTLAFARTHGVETRIARLFATYGPDMSEDAATPLARWIASARKGEPLVVEGAERPYPLLHVADAAEALARLLRANFTRPVNIGHPEPAKAGDVAARVAALAGKGSAVEAKRAPVGHKDTPLAPLPSVETARRALGWEPRLSLDEGLASLFADTTPRP